MIPFTELATADLFVDAVYESAGSKIADDPLPRLLQVSFAYLRMLVSGIVVDDRMDGLSLGNLRVDLIEEADELLMSMVLHVAADDGAIENIERGEQCGGD